MEHVAIMSKEDGLLRKILDGGKTIESRWSMDKRAPFKAVFLGDTVYFKEVGKPVTVHAVVDQLLFFEDLKDDKIKELLDFYGDKLGVGAGYFKNIVGKRYCTLIFLKNIKREEKPFDIDKTGFGNMAAWITVENINQIKVEKAPSQGIKI